MNYSGLEICMTTRRSRSRIRRNRSNSRKSLDMQHVEHAGYDKRYVLLYTEMLFPKQLLPVRNHPIDQDMRASLVYTVSARATQYPRAIHLAVLIFDQYFGNFQPTEGQAHLQPQTVMDVALLIAVKYVYGGTRMAEVLNIHNPDQLEMELAILKVFNWKLSSPTTRTFVDLFLCFNDQDDANLKFLCWYLMDLSLLDRDCSQLYSSILAAACGFLAQFMLDPDAKPKAVIPWDYTTSDLQTMVLLLRDIILQRRFVNTRTKYMSAEFQMVANLGCGDNIPEDYFS
ncbi:Cyclin [Hirschfeldia incana]|nr:Cyclin [Hirschfeldia incana]